MQHFVLLCLLLIPYPASCSLGLRLQRDGHALARALLTPAEAAHFRPLVLSAMAREAAFCGACGNASLQSAAHACLACDHSFRDAARPQKSFLRSRRLEEREPALRALVRHRGLARAAASALGARALRLYQATAFLKEPGDGPTPWHQDHLAIPLGDASSIVTLWLALDDVPAACGALRFLNGSHAAGVPPPSLRGVRLGRRMAAFRPWHDAPLAAAAGGLALVEPRDLRAGDATLHAGWTLHAAGRNACKRARPAVALTYFSEGARVHRGLFRPPAGGAGFRLPSREDAAGLVVTTVEEEEDRLGVRLSRADGGGELVIRLLADDAGTWLPWLLNASPPMLIPGGLVGDDQLVPLVYSAEWDGEL